MLVAQLCIHLYYLCATGDFVFGEGSTASARLRLLISLSTPMLSSLGVLQTNSIHAIRLICARAARIRISVNVASAKAKVSGASINIDDNNNRNRTNVSHRPEHSARCLSAQSVVYMRRYMVIDVRLVAK